MLFHVTATHAEENCPGYNLDKMPDLVAASERSEELAKQFDVKVHSLLNAAPEHVIYAVLETDNIGSIAPFMMQAMPIRSSFKVTPVQTMEDTLTMARKMMAQGGH
jgi:hypothetical protein